MDHFNFEPFADAVYEAVLQHNPRDAEAASGGAEDETRRVGPVEVLNPRMVWVTGLKPELTTARSRDRGWSPNPSDLPLIERLRASPTVQATARSVRARAMAEWVLRVADEMEVRRVAAELRIECARAERLLGGGTARGRTRPSQREGPVPPCWLYWQGWQHRVKSGRCFGLLYYMWKLDTAPIDDVISEVWPDVVLEGSVMSYVSRVNACLPPGYPRRLGRRGNYLTWVGKGEQ
jgi:hypothetical protein